MLQAALEGVVDFSQTQFRDPRWMCRTRELLGGLARENRKQFLTTLLHDVVTGLSAFGRSEQYYKTLSEARAELLTQVGHCYYPWETSAPIEQKKQEIRAYKRGWESRYGKLDDPAVKRRVEAAAAALLRQAAGATHSPTNPLGLKRPRKEARRVKR